MVGGFCATGRMTVMMIGQQKGTKYQMRQLRNFEWPTRRIP